MIFKEHLSREQGLSDLLNYAHFVDENVIINKDGAFLMTYKFRGPDINSASGAELDALTANFNRMATFLEDGWMLHVDELRIPSLVYPPVGDFPDSVSALIDEERRQMYELEGSHYENFQFLTFVWKFPLSIVKTSKHWFVEGLSKQDENTDLTKLLIYFREMVERCVGLISSQFILEKLGRSDLLSYLNTCITGELLPVTPPPDGCFIDVVLGRKNIVGGYVPQIGKNHLYVLSIVGYLNEETIPGLLEEMGTYPLIYRWSNRFIPLSESTAEREIKRYQRNWNNKIKGLPGILKEAIFGRPTTKLNVDAQQMSQETTEALTANRNHSTRFGYWSSEIVIMNENIELLEEASKDITRYLEQTGFACIKESVNTFDAWLGSIPGHGSANVRRVFLDSINLAHVLPLHTIWTGAEFSSSASLLPPKSHPVFYAATMGSTPFRFHMDEGDVGHQLVVGPTGAGKSTYLGFLISQFLRYSGAQVFIFDKDYSQRALTAALGGFHYDIGKEEELSFCPLADLSTKSKKLRAEQFIENLVVLQNIPLTPDIRAATHTAITSLAASDQKNNRSLTVFKSEVQHEAVRSALQYYTLEGQIKLLDSTHDCLKTGYLQTFEMDWLLQQKPEIYLPILGHIFNSIDSLLEEQNEKNPTLIVFEELWFFCSHPIPKKQLKNWLKTLRKKNARLCLATTSLADLYDPTTKTLTDTTAAILESCYKRIFLPNPHMDSEIYDLYRKIGLTKRQIEIVSTVAIPKRHYFVMCPEGNRLIDLGFNEAKPLALSFIGLSQEKGKLLLEHKAQFGNEWIYHWLVKEGFQEWASYWKVNYFMRNVA